MTPDISTAPVPFQEAIDFYRQKIRLGTRAWTDVWQGMHARAFVVAGAQSEALVGDFHDAVTRAIAEGRTLADFRQDFDRIVRTHGWSYKGGRNWRSRVIFDTNMRMAYASGRWQQIQRVKARRPFLRYVQIQRETARPEHAAWHGLILPVDHPFWQTHYPPNGWHCGCSVQQLSQRDLDRLGFTVSADAPPVDLVGRTVRTPDGPVTLQVPRGIDPGFSYNVGEAAWGRGAQALAAERHGAWEALSAPGAPAGPLPPLPVDRPKARLGHQVAVGDEAGLRQALRDALGGADEVVLTDPAGQRVLVGQGIADHVVADPAARWTGREAFWPLIREVVEDPAEVWIGFARSAASGRVDVRRRYVKLVDVGRDEAGRDRTVGVIADVDHGMWSALTAFHGRAGRTAGAPLRNGLLVYRR